MSLRSRSTPATIQENVRSPRIVSIPWAEAAGRFSDWFAWSSAYARAAGINPPTCPYRFSHKERSLLWRDRIVCTSAEPNSLFAAAEWYIMSGWAERLSNEYFVCHAATVERNGRALLLVGSRGAGKTLLAQTLVRRGFRFLGDEFAVIQPQTLDALPFPKALCIKDSGVAMLGSSAPGFEMLPYPPDFSPRYKGALCWLPRRHIVPAPGERFSVRWVILLRGEVESRPPAAVPCWLATKSLFESSWRGDQEDFRVCAALARRAVVWEMERFHLADMADWIQNRVENDGW